MANGQQPAWVSSALIFFSITAIVSFGFFIHFYTQNSALSEQRTIIQKVTIPQLAAVIDGTKAKIPPLENQLVTKQERLQNLKNANSDARIINSNLLAAEAVRLTELTNNTEKIRREFKTAYDEAKDAREEHNAQEKEVLNITAELEKKLVSLRALIKEESHGIEGFQKETRAVLLDIDRNNNKLEERVQELLDQQEISRVQLLADGKVMAARANEGFVIIDLGRRDGLRLGTVFKVFARSGGRNIIKGSIEVTSIGDTQSEAHVIEEITIAEPIIPGDSLHNPVFNPAEAKVFVVKGVFRNFTTDELARFITEGGGIVSDELSTKTHYLIAGADSQKALAEASKYGITILSEDQLIDFIRPKSLGR